MDGQHQIQTHMGVVRVVRVVRSYINEDYVLHEKEEDVFKSDEMTFTTNNRNASEHIQTHQY